MIHGLSVQVKGRAERKNYEILHFVQNDTIHHPSFRISLARYMYLLNSDLVARSNLFFRDGSGVSSKKQTKKNDILLAQIRTYPDTIEK